MEYIELTQSNRTKTISDVYRKWVAKDARLLDVGCGDGILAFNISRILGVKISGCDVLRYTIKPIEFKLMEKPDRLPYPDHSFDTVTFNDVLHHTSYKAQESLIAEAIRVCRKNIIIFEVKPNIGGYVEDFVLNHLEYPLMNVPLTFRSEQKWLTLFKSYGVTADVVRPPKPLMSLVTRVAFNLTKRTKKPVSSHQR
jgi:ubiquinone/menaquinone biosynthesis C-methylase UbiE